MLLRKQKANWTLCLPIRPSISVRKKSNVIGKTDFPQTHSKFLTKYMRLMLRDKHFYKPRL